MLVVVRVWSRVLRHIEGKVRDYFRYVRGRLVHVYVIISKVILGADKVYHAKSHPFRKRSKDRVPSLSVV